jgi:hypothetical protein
MDLKATIRSLEEKRDFYAAAISALRLIAASEKRTEPAAPRVATMRTRRPFSAEARERMSAAQKARWARKAKANGADHATPVTSAPEPELVTQ